LTARDDEGAIVEAEFIRPDWWIEENGIAAGELMPLAIEELGLSGYATIQTVEDCGPIARGDGSVVTGRFTTSRVNVIVRLTVAGPDGTTEVLEGTTVHPIWSVDRNDWIQLSELQEGETLQATDGVATVVSIAIVSTNVPVYNIEVHGEHVYQVGDIGVVVHNACPTNIGVLSTKAPHLTAPGVRVLEGHYIDDIARVMPWRAHYDEFGRLIARTDYNAANKAHGIAATHYHTYDWLWSGGTQIREVLSHIPGEFLP
jgi:YD repeat-containing protein